MQQIHFVWVYRVKINKNNSQVVQERITFHKILRIWDLIRKYCLSVRLCIKTVHYRKVLVRSVATCTVAVTVLTTTRETIRYGILSERQVEVRFRVTAMSSYCDGCRAGAQWYSISDPSPRPPPYPVVVT